MDLGGAEARGHGRVNAMHTWTLYLCEQCEHDQNSPRWFHFRIGSDRNDMAAGEAEDIKEQAVKGNDDRMESEDEAAATDTGGSELGGREEKGGCGRRKIKRSGRRSRNDRSHFGSWPRWPP